MDGTPANMSVRATALSRVLGALDRLEIPYEVVGSLACSAHGIGRATQDVDLVADIRPDQLAEFSQELQPDFYADPEMMRESLRHGRSFNIIHFATSFKFDIFPLQRDEYSQVQFRRRRFEELTLVGEAPVECAVASPEDTVLGKLRWYREGAEGSQTQWHDVRGIVRVRGPELDLDYLRTWASKLGVADLLDRLLKLEPISSE